MHPCCIGQKIPRISRRFLLAFLSIVLFSAASIANVTAQEAVAEIVSIAYPEIVHEGEPFNLTISIQSFSNVTEVFFVKVIRRSLVYVQKEISIPQEAAVNLTFELKLLLSGDLSIEVLLDNELVDFARFSVYVPAPKADVGILIMELIQAEITTIGVGLAALAIFATLFIQSEHKWLVTEAEFTQRLKEQKEKSSNKRKKAIECTSFLLEGKFNESLKHFLDTTLAEEALSETMDLEKREIASQHFERTKKSTIATASVLLVAVAYGYFLIPAAPIIVDSILFVDPNWNGRDILLFLFFFPLSTILLTGMLLIIYQNFRSQFRRFGSPVLFGLFSVSIILLFVLGFNIALFISLIVGFLGGIVTGFYQVHRGRTKQKVLFREELAEIRQLKENLLKLQEKSSSKFRKEVANLRGKSEKQLDYFRFVFETIIENITAERREISVERSLNLVSDKRYRKQEEDLGSVASKAESLISEILAKESSGPAAS